MAEVKLTISDPKTGKSYTKIIQSESEFEGKKLKETVQGNQFGFKGYEFLITGGSDKQGFPLRADLHSQARKKILVVEGVGAKKKGPGIKQRKTVRGNVISQEVAQINLKITTYGQKSPEECLGLIKEETPKSEE